MPIIAFLGKDITEYNANSINYLNALHFYCPEHALELIYFTKYPRRVKDDDAIISIHRLICPLKDCNYTQAILPDFLQPYKHYSAHLITSVLIEAQSCSSALDIDVQPCSSALDIDAIIPSISTVRRWIFEYQPILDEKISQLKTLILHKVKNVVNETILPAGMPMDTLHKLLSFLPAIKSTNTLGAAFIYANALTVPT